MLRGYWEDLEVFAAALYAPQALVVPVKGAGRSNTEQLKHIDV
jgi:hypothetical protein